MRQLSPAGQQALAAVAQRHGFSLDATMTMLEAVMNGNGGMAQFNHPEFSGAGQWMSGGMIMVSDMFNTYLKGQIDGLCQDLAGLVAAQPDLIRTGSFQSQSQGGQYGQDQYQGTPPPTFDENMQQGGGPSLFVPASEGAGNWWPGDLGWPASTGSQNNVRYACFPQSRRLVIDLGGAITVYDTLDHQIGGVSQQQSQGGSLTFTSQLGVVNLTNLPLVSGAGTAPIPSPLAPVPMPELAPVPPSAPITVAPVAVASAAPGNADDILATIDKLADLHGRGILTDAEFSTKKQDLLSRL